MQVHTTLSDALVKPIFSAALHVWVVKPLIVLLPAGLEESIVRCAYDLRIKAPSSDNFQSLVVQFLFWENSDDYAPLRTFGMVNSLDVRCSRSLREFAFDACAVWHWHGSAKWLLLLVTCSE